MMMDGVDDGDDGDDDGDDGGEDGAICSAVRGVLALGNGDGLWWPRDCIQNQCVSVRRLASYVYSST